MAIRSDVIQVRVTPEIKSSLQALADAKGVSLSALAAFALSEYIDREKRKADG